MSRSPSPWKTCLRKRRCLPRRRLLEDEEQQWEKKQILLRVPGKGSETVRFAKERRRLGKGRWMGSIREKRWSTWERPCLGFFSFSLSRLVPLAVHRRRQRCVRGLRHFEASSSRPERKEA